MGLATAWRQINHRHRTGRQPSFAASRQKAGADSHQRDASKSASLEMRQQLDAGNRLVLQYADDYPAILCLSFSSFIVSNLIGLSHGSGCQKAREGNFSF